MGPSENLRELSRSHQHVQPCRRPSFCHASAAEFLAAHSGALEGAESLYNLKIGLAAQLRDGVLDGAASLCLGVAGDHGQWMGCSLWTAPERPLLLSSLSTEAVVALVRYLRREAAWQECREWVGPRDTAAAFAAEWRRVCGRASELSMEQLAYEARSIAGVAPRGGRMIQATESDREIAREWLAAFARECFPRERCDAAHWGDAADRLVDRGLAYLWLDANSAPVSMAVRNRESPNGATVSYVYTPPHSRARGFASRLVGALSQSILDDGKEFCCLFTDASNATSNGVYVRLGYQVVGSISQWSASSM